MNTLQNWEILRKIYVGVSEGEPFYKIPLMLLMIVCLGAIVYIGTPVSVRQYAAFIAGGLFTVFATVKI